ncbi:MAG: Fe2+-dependent dioxygenase [Myxococcota bacterium]
MAFFIDDVLDRPTFEAIAETLRDERLFEDGRSTARGVAKSVKNNEQARSSDGVIRAALEMIEKALWSNADFQAAAIPEKIARITLSRYTEGMRYGEHVDEAFISGVRTDLSFTLFLSDPESYVGGELVIRRHDGDESVKLPSASLYLYPSNSLHSVSTVESGIRLAAVGWVRSRVRSDEQRAVLYDLHQALRQLPRDDATQGLRLNLLRARNSLLRMWAD